MDPKQNVGTTPVTQNTAGASENIMAQGISAKKNNKGMIFGMVFLAILAIGGIGFGVWAKMDGDTKEKQYNTQIEALKKTNNELMDKIAEGGEGGSEEGSSTGTTVDTEDYIYVGEWGVKFKIPDNLQYVSYEVHDFDYGDYAGTSLCVGGATIGHGDEKPSFVGDTTSIGLHVCVSKNTKSTEEGSGATPWASVVPVGEYYIQGPQATIDEATAEWESESVSAIINMLSMENMSNI